MSCKIRFLEHPALHGMDPISGSEYYRGTVDFAKMEIGDLCFYHYKSEPCLDKAHLVKLHLTQHYFQHNAARPPLILALPDLAYVNGKIYFLVDGQCYSGKCLKCGQGISKHKHDDKSIAKCQNGAAYEPKGYYDGWTVSGNPPMITVHPSVNYNDEEHGIRHYHGFVQNGVIGDG